MTNYEKILVEKVVSGNIREAQAAAKAMLENNTLKKDRSFCDYNIARLNTSLAQTIELPYNLQDLLIAEDASNFPIDRFYLREEDQKVASEVMDAYRVSAELQERGINYKATLILYGKSGVGKTMLARYIAYRMHLPFLYVRISNIVDSYMGKTSQNIARIFEFLAGHPCVMCFDEIDVLGMARGQKNDVGEMNRIVITLMQELDRAPNNIILIGTTNRFDRLDTALVRRFELSYEMLPLNHAEAVKLAETFFRSSRVEPNEWFADWCGKTLIDDVPASGVVNLCTRKVIEIVKDQLANEKENAE